MKQLIPYEQTGLPVYDIDLNAPPGERWREVCLAEGDNMHALIGEFVQLIQSNPDSLPPWLRGLIAPALHAAGSVGTLVASVFGKEYVGEIKGIAKYAELPLGHVFIGNLCYDFTQILEGLQAYRLGCSSYSTMIDGAPVLVRNMDWSMPESVGTHSRLIRFHRGKHHYQSLSILGSVGILSAQRTGHWAVTLNQAPAEKVKIAPFQWPSMCRLRAVCDEMVNFAAFRNSLQTYQTMTPFFAHLVGTRMNQQIAVTGLVREFYERYPADDKPLIQTNHYCHEELGELNPEEWFDDGVTYWDTYERERILKKRLQRLPQNFKTAHQRMLHPKVTHAATQHQLILQPSSGAFYASVLR